jgi:predicted Zn-dependent protease
MKPRFQFRYLWLFVAVLLASCKAILPTPPVSENSAVVGLIAVARADADAGQFPNAIASLERALRIEPKNPRLWQEFARVRMKQGDYVQAENLAARSNSWAGSDNDLRAENWRLIAEARTARGDDAGAKAALDRAKQSER